MNIVAPFINSVAIFINSLSKPQNVMRKLLFLLMLITLVGCSPDVNQGTDIGIDMMNTIFLAQ